MVAQGSVLADMVLEKELKVLSLDLQTAGQTVTLSTALGDLKGLPARRHTRFNKATSLDSATPYGPSIQRQNLRGDHSFPNHHTSQPQF